MHACRCVRSGMAPYPSSHFVVAWRTACFAQFNCLIVRFELFWFSVQPFSQNRFCFEGFSGSRSRLKNRQGLPGTNYLYTPHRCTWLTMHRVIWLSDLFCQVRHFATRVWQVQRSRLQSLWHVPKRSSPVLNCSECVHPLTPVGLYYTRWTLNVWSI